MPRYYIALPLLLTLWAFLMFVMNPLGTIPSVLVSGVLLAVAANEWRAYWIIRKNLDDQGGNL